MLKAPLCTPHLCLFHTRPTVCATHSRPVQACRCGHTQAGQCDVAHYWGGARGHAVSPWLALMLQCSAGRKATHVHVGRNVCLECNAGQGVMDTSDTMECTPAPTPRQRGIGLLMMCTASRMQAYSPYSCTVDHQSTLQCGQRWRWRWCSRTDWVWCFCAALWLCPTHAMGPQPRNTFVAAVPRAHGHTHCLAVAQCGGCAVCLARCGMPAGTAVVCLLVASTRVCHQGVSPGCVSPSWMARRCMHCMCMTVASR